MKHFLLMLGVLLTPFFANSQSFNSNSSIYCFPGDTLTISGSGINPVDSQVSLSLGQLKVELIQSDTDKVKFVVPDGQFCGKLIYTDNYNKKSISSKFDVFIRNRIWSSLNFNLIFPTATNTTIENNFGGFGQTWFYDLDNDGKVELLAIANGALEVYHYNSGVFEEKFKFGQGTYLSEILDLNMDGKFDVVLDSLSYKRAYINVSTQGNPVFELSDTFNFDFKLASSLRSNIGLVDFNGDGRGDLLKSNYQGISDSNIMLNLPNSGNGYRIKKYSNLGIAGGINASSGSFTVVNLNEDQLTDLIFSYRDSSVNKDKVKFLLNTSVLDTIRFSAIDSLEDLKMDTFQNSNYNERLDLNKDGKKELMINNIRHSNEGEDSYGVVFSMDSSSLFSVYPKVGGTKSPYYSLLMDYDFDSIPDYLMISNDSLYHIKLSEVNDTIVLKRTFLRSEISDIRDLNYDNIPDLINFKSNPPTVWLGQNLSYRVVDPYIVNSAFDSLDLIQDSISIKVFTVEQIEIDSIKSRNSIVFYTDRHYTTALTDSIVLNKSTDMILYYGYRFTEEGRDTFSMKFAGQETDFAYLNIKKRDKYAVIKSINKRFAVPGDTLLLKGKHLFKELRHVSLRLSNRRCEILGTSTDTLIKFIYPSMTGKAQLVLIDSFKKKQFTTPFYIYPKYKSDSVTNVDSTFFDQNLPYFFSTENQSIIGSYYSEFELPSNSNSGHIFIPNSCIIDTFDQAIVPFGTFRFNTDRSSDYQRLKINSDLELTEKFNFTMNNGPLMDLDGNGLFDNLYLMDSLKTYFCTSATENQLDYELRFLSPPQIWAYQFSLEYDWFPEIGELNNDGRLDFILNSPLDINKFYIFNLNMAGTGFELMDSANYINRDKWSFEGFIDIDEDGFKDQIYNTFDDTFRYLYFNKNLSKYGQFQYSNESVLIAKRPFKNYPFSYNFEDIDNDGKVELLEKRENGSENSTLFIYTKKQKGATDFKFLDSTHYSGYFYSLNDVDNDGKPELLAKKIYKIELVNDSIASKEIYTGLAYKGDYNRTLLMDFNDDQLVDLFDGNKICYNKALMLKVGSKNRIEFTIDSFEHSVTKSIWVSNIGNGNIQIDTILFMDSSYSCTLNDSLMFDAKSKISKGDSLCMTIKFEPSSRLRKQFNCKAIIKYKNSEFYSVFDVKGIVRQPAIIESVVPNIYFAGDTLLIKGRYLNCYKKPIIYFDETIAEVLSFNDSMMLLIAPDGNNYGKITLWDTFANLYSVSPFPTNYAFIGSKNPLNDASFEVVKLGSTRYSANFIDVNRDGLMDWAYLNNGATGFMKNNSNSDSIQLNDIPYPNLGTLPYNGNNIEILPGYSTNNIHSTTFVTSFTGTSFDIGFNHQYTSSYLPDITNYGPLSRQYLNDIDGNGKPELNVKLFGPSTLFIELDRFYEDFGCGQKYEQLKTRTTTSAEFGGGGIHTFDFDGDGKAELLYLDTVFKIAFNTSVKDSIMKSNVYRFNTVFDGNYNVRDLNLDGKLDIIANRRLNGNENELVFFRNTSTKGNLSFVTSLDTFPVELSYAKMEVTDFNGDLLPDLAFVGGYFVNDTIDFYTNLSDANNIRFGNNARFRVPGSEILSKHTDFNNDGKTDLLISTDSGVYVLINKSISGYLSRTLYSGSSLFGTPLSLDLVIYSDGGDTLKIDRINLPPGFSLSNSSGLLRFGLGTGISFPILIAPGDSFVLQIENDSLLAPGKYTDEVELFNNAKNKPFVLKIQRDILASPVAHLNKTTLNFGDREYNSAAIDSLVLKNTGNDTLKIASILLSDSTNFKFLSINPNVLLPNDSVWIKVKFLSQKTGSYFENIWIKNNSHDTLVGVVLEAQTVRPVLPDSVVIDMGTVKKGTKKTVFYELVNTGKDSLEMNSPISFSGSMFKMSQVDLSKTFVKAGDSVRLKIEFDATVFGLQNEEYQYNYVSGNFKTKFVFKGWSIGSNLQLSSKQIELGNIRKGKKRNYRIQFSNTGNQTLVIRSLDASNSNWKVGVCDTKDSIQSNGNSEICLEIDPVVNGVLMDSIKIICNDLDSIHFIKVKAEVISAEPILVQQADTIKEFVGQYDKSVISIRNIGNDTMFNVLGSFANVSNVKVKIKNNLSNTILPGAQQDFDLYFHPLSIVNIKDNFKLESMYDTTLFSSGIQFVSYNGAFGDLDRNSIYASVNKTKDTVLKIKNIGNYKFKLSGLTNVSSQVNYLPIVNEVLPDDELAFNVKISPNVYSGSIVDTLKLIAIVDSLPIQKNYPIHYYLLYPKIELSATGFDYGLVNKGSEAMKNLAVKNSGNDTLFYKLKMPAGFESNQGNDTILMAGQTKNLQIKFKPNQLKVYLDSIDVIANSQIRHNFVRLTGISKLHKDSFNLYSSTGDLDFGKVRINDSLLKTVEIRNDGLDSITLKALINHSAFKLKTSSTLTLLKGESKFVNLEFHPSLDINYNGKLIFTNLYGDSIKSIDVRGKGHTTSVLNSSIQDILVYPNPANDVVIMTSIKLIHSIYAYDQNGKKFDVQFNNENDLVVIDTKEWTNGVYLLTVTSGSDQYLVKLVVMHD